MSLEVGTSLDAKGAAGTSVSKNRWSWPDIIASAGVLVALLAVFAQWRSSHSELVAARALASEQHAQVLAQLAAQQQFSQVLQSQQHELALRQLQAQDSFTRDQIQLQRSLEESWLRRQVSEERRSACEAARTARSELQRAIYDDLTDAVIDFNRSVNVDIMYAAVSKAVMESARDGSWSAQSGLGITDLDWTMIKDIGSLMVESEQKRSDRESVIGRLQVLLLSILAAYPDSIEPSVIDFERAIPLPITQSPEFLELAAHIGRGAARRDVEGSSPDDWKDASTLWEAFNKRRNEDDGRFVTATSNLRREMVGAMLSPPPSCAP